MAKERGPEVAVLFQDLHKSVKDHGPRQTEIFIISET